jgi:hypothetical protein
MFLSCPQAEAYGYANLALSGLRYLSLIFHYSFFTFHSFVPHETTPSCGHPSTEGNFISLPLVS